MPCPQPLLSGRQKAARGRERKREGRGGRCGPLSERRRVRALRPALRRSRSDEFLVGGLALLGRHFRTHGLHEHHGEDGVEEVAPLEHLQVEALELLLRGWVGGVKWAAPVRDRQCLSPLAPARLEEAQPVVDERGVEVAALLEARLRGRATRTSCTLPSRRASSPSVVDLGSMSGRSRLNLGSISRLASRLSTARILGSLAPDRLSSARSGPPHSDSGTPRPTRAGSRRARRTRRERPRRR